MGDHYSSKYNKLMIKLLNKYAKPILQYYKIDKYMTETCLLYSVYIAYKSIGMDNSYVSPTYSRPGCRCPLTGRGARTPGRRPTKGSRSAWCVSSSGPLSCCRSHCRRWHGLARRPSRECRLLTTVVKVCPLLHCPQLSRLKQQTISSLCYIMK